jgi:hypothetical protein
MRSFVVVVVIMMAVSLALGFVLEHLGLIVVVVVVVGLLGRHLRRHSV